MPRVVAFEDVKALQAKHIGRGAFNTAVNTPFLKSSAATPDQPVAFLSQRDLNQAIAPHWHIVDQFQVIAGGKGKLGRHEVSPYCVHFARAYTPYGPIVDDGKNAVAFFTLRARFDPGGNFLPATKDKLRQIPDRRPWQISRKVTFPSEEAGMTSGAVCLREIPQMKDDQGLFAYSLSMAPNAESPAPDPSHGGGQYLLVVKGSLWHGGKEHKAFTVVFVEPADGPFGLRAGAEGLDAIIMNFPNSTARVAVKALPAATAGFRKLQCQLCAFAYDEALGLPDDGVPAGTRWEDVPESWSCPDCAASKSDFQILEVQQS